MASKRRQAANSVEQADIAIAEIFTPVRNRRGVKALGQASEIGDQPPLYVIAGSVLASGLAMGDRRTTKAGLRMLASHFLAIRFKNAVKHLVDRTRPNLIPEGRYEMGKGQRSDTDHSSFPSGHTASSVAVARALGREYPSQHGAALALAGAIAAAQVVRSKHYVSDLVAGALVGLAAEKLAHLWLKQMAKA